MKDADKVLALIKAHDSKRSNDWSERWRVAWLFEGAAFYQGWIWRVATFATKEAAIQAIELKFPSQCTKADLTYAENVENWGSDDPRNHGWWREIGYRDRGVRFIEYPEDPAWDLRVMDRGVASRVYFVDANTGEELYSAGWLGTSSMASYNGKNYEDTCLSLEVVDLDTRIKGRITADWFPGRSVLVKLWRPGEMGKPGTVEVLALVDRFRGWWDYVPNLPKVKAGAAAKLWKVAPRSKK